MEKELLKALDRSKSKRERAVLLTLNFPEKDLDQLIRFLKNPFRNRKAVMKKSNAKTEVRSGLADKEALKDLLFIQKNILNQGPLAGMDIQDQIKKIKSVLKKALHGRKIKAVSGAIG